LGRPVRRWGVAKPAQPLQAARGEERGAAGEEERKVDMAGEGSLSKRKVQVDVRSCISKAAVLGTGRHVKV
jgi:hypothetical protein